jgi:hypothetical protein
LFDVTRKIRAIEKKPGWALDTLLELRVSLADNQHAGVEQ